MKKFNMFKKANNDNNVIRNELKENSYPIPKEDNTEVEFKEAISFEPNNLYILDDSGKSDYQAFQVPTNVYDTFSNINRFMIESSESGSECIRIIKSFLSSVFGMFSNSCINLSTSILYEAHYSAKIIDYTCGEEDYMEEIHRIIDITLNDYNSRISNILLYSSDYEEYAKNYITYDMIRDVNIMTNTLGTNIYNFITRKISVYVLSRYSNKEDLAKAYDIFNKIFADFMSKLINESSIFALNLLNVLHFTEYYYSMTSSMKLKYEDDNDYL